jgi:hypothetical protein
MVARLTPALTSTVAQLVQGGVDAGGSAVPDPMLVSRLIAQWTTSSVFLSAEQWAVPVAGVPEVCAQLDNQPVAVNQYRPSPAALPEDGHMFIVACQVDVFDLKRKGLTDAETELGNQAEQQPVTATMDRDGRQDGGNLPRAQTAWCGWIETDTVEPPHRVSRDELVTVRPGEEAGNRRLLTGPRCGRQMRDRREEAAQAFWGDGRGGTGVEAEQAAEVSGVGAPGMHRSIGVSHVGEEVGDEGLEGAFLR